MIGCLIAGGLALFAVSRLIHARRWGHGWGGCGRRHGGWHGGTARRRHARLGAATGGGGPDDGDAGAASFRNDGGPEGWAAAFAGSGTSSGRCSGA